MREAVTTGLVPLLKASRGFQGHWLLKCSDGDCAGISIFDTAENATAAIDNTLAWVEAHIREFVVLPPEAMFGAEVEQLA